MDPGDRKYQHQVRAKWHVSEEHGGSNPLERVMAGAPVAFSLIFPTLVRNRALTAVTRAARTARVEELQPSCDRVVGERGLRLWVIGASALGDW